MGGKGKKAKGKKGKGKKGKGKKPAGKKGAVPPGHACVKLTAPCTITLSGCPSYMSIKYTCIPNPNSPGGGGKPEIVTRVLPPSTVFDHGRYCKSCPSVVEVKPK